MEIPKYNELYFPLMKLLKDDYKEKKDLYEPLANHFNLSEEDINREYESGNGKIFEDRTGWALSDLFLTDLIDRPQRGVYKLNDKGKDLLNKSQQETEQYIRKVLENRRKKTEQETGVKQNIVNNNFSTPQEELSNSFQEIKQVIYDDILSTILSKSPRSFEEIVVQLLQKMGYGEKIKNSGLVTQYTNDGGIDGIIKEDILGFGRIHIQAKRYDPKNTIQRDEIQKFVGALAVAQSNKGVFITTSNFSKGAADYANSLNNTTNIVLIDGQKLAEYIYEYSLGMQTEQIIEIKKLDVDYWESLS